MAIAALPALAGETAVGYGSGTSSSDARFGAQLGAGSQWESTLGNGSGAGVQFGGGVRLGCSGIDLDAFLRAFDAKELLSELRNSLLGGAQAEATDYVITLAYANPTIASVLDMMDKKYTARFASFAEACNAQAARARGEQSGARAMADAGDECFDQETAQGTAPTEAYRRCSIQRSFDSINLPASSSIDDFLRKYTHVNVTRELEVLLSLLPDERIAGGSLQMRPAQATVASMAQVIREQSRAALDRIDAGVDPSVIPACSADALLAPPVTGDGCLPASAVPLVSSSAFASARLLGPASRTLFKDALSSQIAIAAMYSSLLELFQQIARIDVRDGSGADAAHAESRRRQLQQDIGQLLVEADTQVKAQSAKSQLARSQILALEQVEGQLDAEGSATKDANQRAHFGARDLLHLFSDRNGSGP